VLISSSFSSLFNIRKQQCKPIGIGVLSVEFSYMPQCRRSLFASVDTNVVIILIIALNNSVCREYTRPVWLLKTNKDGPHRAVVEVL